MFIDNFIRDSSGNIKDSVQKNKSLLFIIFDYNIIIEAIREIKRNSIASLRKII